MICEKRTPTGKFWKLFFKIFLKRNQSIRTLETAIGEPAFRRLMEQVTSAESSLVIDSAEPSSSTDGQNFLFNFF